MGEIQKSYYAIIPANVRYDDDLTPNAKLLYGEITALCNERGYCWASNSYFAELYKVSKVSISKWINQLVEKGYINSELQYKEGTKEILNRYLTIVNTPIKEKFNRYETKVNDPVKENFNTPIKEKFKDNNTVINNTSNNTSNKTDRQRPVSSVGSDTEFLKVKENFSQHIREPNHQDLKKLDEAMEFYEPLLILEAINQAKGKGKTFAYVLGILDNWRKEDGIKTYKDWQVKMNAKRQQEHGASAGRTSKESLDDFYKQLERDKQAWGG